jgi:8-oxo-dGTP pyrophosphatase MutT (NUDIX family)
VSATVEPATPRPAATLILLRRGGKHVERGVEVLLVRRSPEARFMPGVWVFPGGTVQEADAGDEEAAHRACAIRELEEEAGIALGDDVELHPWSRWITPEAVPIRFDTRFYVALAPPHSPPEPDGAETTEAAWMEPGSALEAGRAGELSLVFPTIKHLESLLPYRTAEEVLAAARDREIEPVLPRVVAECGAERIVLPGEPGY